MKTILAITACLKRCSIAIKHENQTYESNHNIDAAANLAKIAANLLTFLKIDKDSIQGIITSSGPGSFTGIRVAQSLAKGLALALKIPSISIDYFEVIENISAIKNKTSKSKLILIKSDINHYYFKSIKSHITKIGVISIDELYKIYKQYEIILGESPFSIEHIDDFRNAKYLLNFSERISFNSTISPLYINSKETK